MNFKDYKAVKALNLSSLVEIERSPAHFKYKLENPIEETEALSKGRLIH